MKRFIVLAPSLLAILPSLFIYVINKEVAKISVALFLLALFTIGLIIFFIFLVIQFIVKDYSKATVLATLLVIEIFYYVHFFQIIHTVHVLNIVSSRHRFTVPIWGFTFIIPGYFVLVTKKNLKFAYNIIGIFT